MDGRDDVLDALLYVIDAVWKELFSNEVTFKFKKFYL